MTKLSQILGWPALSSACAALALPLLLATTAMGPKAPAALDRADSMVLTGELEQALALYTQIEQQSWSQERAATAAWHAGMAAALAQRDLDAIDHFDLLIERWPQDPRATEASVQLAVLLSDSNPKQAAAALVDAAQADPSHTLAPAHMLQAASLLESSQETTAAWALYERVARTWPESGSIAQLAMARMRLEAGDAASAQELYEQVLAGDSTEDLKEIARLGLSIAQEDLGDFDAVLAELNELDLSEELRERRRDRVQGRVSPP